MRESTLCHRLKREALFLCTLSTNDVFSLYCLKYVLKFVPIIGLAYKIEEKGRKAT